MAKHATEVWLESEEFSCDQLRIRQLTGREAISQIFSFDLDVYELLGGGDAESAVDPQKMLGARVSLVFAHTVEGNRRGEELRRVNGIIAEIHDGLQTEAAFRRYRLRVVPSAHQLSLIETHEIFLDLTVPELCKQKLAAVYPDDCIDLRLQDEYAKRDIITQYRESDLAFVSRLTEHLGISFFFEHEGNEDRIVITDHPAGFISYQDRDALSFSPRGEMMDIYRLEAHRKLVPRVYAVRDYNYRTPQIELMATAAAPSGFGGGVVEYGGHFKTPEEAQRHARVRAEEGDQNHLVYEGDSDICAMTAGGTFMLEGHPRLEAQPLLVTDVEHHLTQVVGAFAGGDDAGYRNSFHALPALQPYRPPRRTPRPRIHGLVTGIVDAGQTSDSRYAQLDEQGRYLVRFIFDTSAQVPCSRRVRMLQPQGGPGGRMHYPLSPGTEVLVAFVDGDPDRPLITATAPTPEAPSPVDQRNAGHYRVETTTGVMIHFGDAHY